MIKKICVDWGNTLCRVTGEFSGPMIEWPSIELMPGAREALAQLHSIYPIFVATNAKDSTIDQINAVMERVGLAEFVDHIFTPRELEIGKESPLYFERIAASLECLPDEILMIGDDPAFDIRHAWTAGFQTCLFQSNLPVFSPVHVPIHQYEANSWAELLGLLPVSRPTLKESLSWLQREQGSFLLLQHVQTVAAIAYWFAVRLRENGVMVDSILAHRGGLLHDLDKLIPGRPAAEHGKMGAAMLREMGYPELADIVESHVMTAPEKIRFSTKEAELVFLADKLGVRNNQIGSVKDRLDDLDARYPQNKQFRAVVEAMVMEIQRNLCEQMGIPEEKMLSQIQASLMGN
jgi:putative hydrolase of the HAD superfamily